MAQPPKNVEKGDVEVFEKIVKNKHDEIVKMEQHDKVIGNLFKNLVRLYFLSNFLLLPGFIIFKYVTNKQRQKLYNKLQFQYILMRFFDEEFCGFLEGAEKK